MKQLFTEEGKCQEGRGDLCLKGDSRDEAWPGGWCLQQLLPDTWLHMHGDF